MIEINAWRMLQRQAELFLPKMEMIFSRAADEELMVMSETESSNGIRVIDIQAGP